MEPDRWSRLAADPATVHRRIRRDRITRSLVFTALGAAVVVGATVDLDARGASLGFTEVFLLAVLAVGVVTFTVIQLRLRRPRQALTDATARYRGFYGLALMPVDGGLHSANSLVFATDGLWLLAPSPAQDVLQHIDIADIDTITMSVRPRGGGSIAYLQARGHQTTLLEGRCMRLFRRQEGVDTFLARLA